MLHKILRGIAPAIVFAAAFATSGCDGNISINGENGVPLAELDTAGKTPTGIVLAGPDSVIVTQGSELKIEASGDAEAVAALRFSLKDDTLGIMRDSEAKKTEGKARVMVTLPSLEKVVLAGSGTLEAAALSGEAEITIAGSGTATTDGVDAKSLEVTIAGSGTYRASGTTSELDLTIAGSGAGDMAGLTADTAEVTIAGSGKAAFASDGTVEANVMGSGDVTVSGNAKCTIKSMGSGTLHCNPANTTTVDAAPAGPVPPAPPAPPSAPATPE